MTPETPGDHTLERYRNGYLKLRSVLYDRTTGLPAYPMLYETVRGWLEKHRYAGVIHVEAANLDLVESLYGWQVFDRILARVSRGLRALVGAELPEGSLLSVDAVAGDRFVIFVPARPTGEDVDPEFLARTAREVEARLEEDLEGEELSGLSPRLVLRTGHALVSENPFYRFERRIRSAVEEARTLRERREGARERAWTGEVRRIIRDAAVSTVFQPVVDLRTREVIGYEAFSRGPKDTMFEKPGTLFALSDRVGAVVDLDRLCRNQALRASGSVAARGKLFLNVHTRSLGGPEWSVEGIVRELLEAASLSPADLVIEVSERGFNGAPEPMAEAFDRLKGLGFGLALDDVGTGYASLATLERVRPDFLKVDVSLVRGIHENLIKQELVGSLVHIGARLGAQVIAEGIETEDEASTLCEAGARYGQGYLFAVPSPSGRARTHGGGRGPGREGAGS